MAATCIKIIQQISLTPIENANKVLDKDGSFDMSEVGLEVESDVLEEIFPAENV